MKRPQVITTLTKHPWLIYGIDVVKNLPDNGFLKKDFMNLAGVPRKLAKTLLYYLIRYGFLKSIPRNGMAFYIPTDDCLQAFKLIKRRASYKDKVYLYELGNMYVLVVIRKRRISAYIVSKEIVNKVREALERRHELSIDEMSVILSMRRDVIIKVLRILELLGIVRRKMTGNKVKKYSIMKT